MIILAISKIWSSIFIVAFFVSIVVVLIAAMIDIQRYDVSLGGQTWKEWWNELIHGKKEHKQLPNEYILIKNFIDVFSSETPPSPDPYSGSEWSSSDFSWSSSPTQTEAPSSDQASSHNVAASS